MIDHHLHCFNPLFQKVLMREITECRQLQSTPLDVLQTITNAGSRSNGVLAPSSCSLTACLTSTGSHTAVVRSKHVERKAFI